MKSFIKEARVKGEEVLLIYTMPIVPQKTTSEELAVLPIVQYGGRYWTVPNSYLRRNTWFQPYSNYY
jgi:hypothetical protein